MIMPKFQDDKFVHLVSDIDKIRKRHRQYLSFSNEAGALEVTREIFYNALDELKNPRSPGDKIEIEFDERTGFIKVKDNGRGIPTDILEEVFTSLNMGSNIDTSDKANLKTDILGSNGVGSLATCALAERVVIRSNRGPSEGIYKELVFEEGVKISEDSGKCDPKVHGMTIEFKPSKVMGKNTRIVWSDFHNILVNTQYLEAHKIKITSFYTDKKGNVTEEKYSQHPFQDILDRNNKENIISSKYYINIDQNDVIEEIEGINIKRFVNMDIAFLYTTDLNPYIDSFSNGNNTVDNGDHLEGTIEAICRYFQNATKNSMSEKERERLNVKWDDVRTGLSVCVALHTNFERLYTGQTKHKVVNDDIRRIIVQLTMESLQAYFTKNPNQLKDIIAIVKMNAKVRHEGDKVRTAVVKENLNNWSSYKIKNYDPCTNKALKEYKELFIIEGDSAKGSLKLARDPRYQALFAIRGVSMNAWDASLDQIVGDNGNKEFTNLIKVMGCNVGSKFDINKLQFDKIIIASDADVDGLFIRSLLMTFYFKLFPEIIEEGRLFIAEPPLYRVADKKNPFVINMGDYIDRYVKAVSKDYKIGYYIDENNTDYLDKQQLIDFLSDTASYVDEIKSLGDHFLVNHRLLELAMEMIAKFQFDGSEAEIPLMVNQCKNNIDSIMDRINEEFPELYYDEKDNLIIGPINASQQLFEISESFIRKATEAILMIEKWGPGSNSWMILRDLKTATDHKFSMMEALKVLKKYQPDIEHRFKGLGENDASDIKTTIMDPNTRMLIRVHISDIENDMKTFQLLRGHSPSDAFNRKMMMKEFKISKDAIDT